MSPRVRNKRLNWREMVLGLPLNSVNFNFWGKKEKYLWKSFHRVSIRSFNSCNYERIFYAHVIWTEINDEFIFIWLAKILCLLTCILKSPVIRQISIYVVNSTCTNSLSTLFSTNVYFTVYVSITSLLR